LIDNLNEEEKVLPQYMILNSSSLTIWWQELSLLCLNCYEDRRSSELLNRKVLACNYREKALNNNRIGHIFFL